MLRASWKSLLHRKLRLIMSATAIVLGVAFVSGSFIFTDSLSRSFTSIMTGSVGDVVVRPVTPKTSSFDSTTTTKTVPGSLVPELAKLPGAARADGNVSNQGTFVVSTKGKLIGGSGAPGLAVNYTGGPAAHGAELIKLTQGAWPTGPGQVVLDKTTFANSGYHVGDEVNLVTTGSEAKLTARLVGVGEYTSGGLMGASIAIFNTPTAQHLFTGGKNEFTDIWVSAKPGTSQSDLRAEVAKHLPAGYEAITGDAAGKEAANSIQDALGFINTFLLVFAAVALLVGSFLIVNTFGMLVAQRSRELALFRAMGASRRQVGRSVLFEAGVVGVIGSVAGFGIGIGVALAIKALFKSIGLDLSGSPLVIEPRTFIVSMVVGIVVTMVAAWFPARRAGKVAPVAAMRGDAVTTEARSRRLYVVGTVLTSLGAIALAVGLYSGIARPMLWIGIGIFAVVVGVALISPVVGRPLILGLGAINRRLFGSVGMMARENAQRSPGRTAATASALMIGVTLVSMMAVFGASAKASTDKLIQDQFSADFAISSAINAPFSAQVVDSIAKLPGVADVARLRYDSVKVNGKSDFVVAVEPEHISGAGDFTMYAGSLSHLTADQIAVTKKRADADHLTMGEKLTIDRVGVSKTFTIAAIFKESAVLESDIVMTVPGLTAIGGPDTDNFAFVTKDPGVSAATVKAAIDKDLAGLPVVNVRDQAEFAKAQHAQINQLLYMIYALLGLAVIIAILGIINTLGLSVVERTREIGLLRAVGLSRRQLKRMLRLESIVIALLGAGLGVVLGLAFGVALQRALANDGIAVLQVPWTQLVAFVVLAGLVGVFASWLPGVRAAKLDILDAIATE